MLNAFPPLRALVNDEYLGADSWLTPLVQRSNWLYGQAHGYNYGFVQRWGQMTGATVPIWEGETPQRSEHPTFYFGARLALSTGSVAYLQYLRNDSVWVTIDSDNVTTQGRLFKGNAVNAYSLTALTPKESMWRFRVYATGGYVNVYRAYLSGDTGVTAWPTVATFANSPTVHNASDFNALRQAQERLYTLAQKPQTGGLANSGHMTTSTGALFRFTFRYGPTKKLYVRLKAMDGTSSNWGQILLLASDYKNRDWDGVAGDTTLGTLSGATIADTTYAYDLSGYGLTAGNFYAVQIEADAGPTVHVLCGTGLGDLAAVTRTYTPKADWIHGDQPTAAQLNTIGSDIAEMRDAAAQPNYTDHNHWLATYQLPVSVTGGPEHDVSYLGVVGWWIGHRWRWLRYRGTGKIYSSDGANEASLPDTSDGPGIYDLERLDWLAYGDGYWVGNYNAYGETPELTVAYEDYDV